MSLELKLEKSGIPKRFQEIIMGYYEGMEDGHEYARFKLEQWKTGKDFVVYTSSEDSHEMGWIIFHPQKSTVEEIQVDKKWIGKDLEKSILDALIFQESLVSMEIFKKDKERQRHMIDYGFRPTRSFESGGFELIRMDLSTSIYLEKVKGRKPFREYKKKEQVFIEKVPSTRTHNELKASLTNVLNGLGGLDKYVKPGQTVVIKPNVVADHGMRDGKYMGGVVTDLGLVKALVDLLLAVAGKVIVAEGSSINRAETKKLFELYGYDKLVDIDPSRVSLVDINKDELVRKDVPGGKRMLSREIPVTLDQADVIINLPVMKTHFAALVSLSIKNLQGVIPPLEKYMTHFFGLWQNLINIYHIIKPSLIIIDGLTAQQDFGPVYGTPKPMNLLIGGTNPVAVDTVTTHIMGLDPKLSPPVYLAYMQGLGPIELEKIENLGAAIEDVRDPFREAVINLESGENFIVHDGNACTGCKGYFHYVLHKLRRPDEKNPGRLLIDRPFDKKVNVYLGPNTDVEPNPDEANVFLGICQQHHAQDGSHLPGCPPHAEVIMKGIFSLYPDVERPQYADENADACNTPGLPDHIQSP